MEYEFMELYIYVSMYVLRTYICRSLRMYVYIYVCMYEWVYGGMFMHV